MVKISTYLLSKARLTLLAMFLISPCLQAQEWVKIKTVDLKAAPEKVSIDRQGNIYVSSSNSGIDKYGRDGTLLNHFSPTKQGSPDLIEAWQGLKVFAFYRAFQEYIFLNRFLSNSERYSFESQNITSYVSLATIATNNAIWLLDGSAMSLKKVDITSNELLLETSFSLNLKAKNHDFTYLREYQNLLFIGDKENGVLVFDNIGNYTETIPLKGLDFFSFDGNELVGIVNGKAVFFDIYSNQKKEVSLPDPSYSFILKENNRIFLFGANQLDLYEVN